MRFNTLERYEEEVTPLVAIGRGSDGFQQYEEEEPRSAKVRPSTRGGQVLVVLDKHYTPSRTVFTKVVSKDGTQLFPRQDFTDGLQLIVRRVFPRIGVFGSVEAWAYLCELEADPEA